MRLEYMSDDINFWKSYEKTKPRIFINFDKNEKLKREFEKLVDKLKIEVG